METSETFERTNRPSKADVIIKLIDEALAEYEVYTQTYPHVENLDCTTAG